MPGETVIRGSQPVEWVSESSFATEESEASYNWFGIGTSWSVEQGVETESIPYLPEYNSDNKLEKRSNVKYREMYSGDVTYHPQNYDLFQYFTGADGSTSDSPGSVQVGEVNEDVDPEEFRRLLGGVGEELSLSVEEDSTAEVEGSFIFADSTDWSEDDYTGTGGSHATEDTTEPYTFDDLTNVQWGGTDMDGAIQAVTLTVSNELAEVRDANNSRPTQLSSIVPVDREITVEIDITYDSFDMLTDVRSYTAKDFTFTLGGTTFTVSDVKFPSLPYEYTADDLVADSLSSGPATGLSWS
jgi:hypothetical protein